MRHFQHLVFKLIRKLRLKSLKGSSVHATSKVESGTSFVNSTMDRHSFCGYDCEITNADVGALTSIANFVVIGGGRHPIEWAGMSPAFYAGRDSIKMKYSQFERSQPIRTIVGNDVWIGYRAIVMQGVNIGNGAVIGAGSVVTKDVPAYAIVGGAPARVLKYRFEPELRLRLEKSQWWNLNDDLLARLSAHIREPEIFLRELEACVSPTSA